MKITAQEEYGLRILLRVARSDDEKNTSIQALSELEGLSHAYTAKLTRILRKGGFINSTPGNIGGYVLAKSPSEINVNTVLKHLGGALFSKEFCGDYNGNVTMCTNSVDCSIRSLWKKIQYSVDQVLDQITLAELIGSEASSNKLLKQLSN
ncbi:Rrf2 family iron-sulfur cluster assembly transcriptional regulator [Pedobacter sp. UYP30]|uniref:RrF2 family transcriptional regulator n=1 Tax=Pedobacter sp. UYP30 TaxID=1756400 RepID=UPI003393DD10